MVLADWIAVLVLGCLWGAQIILRSFEFRIGSFFARAEENAASPDSAAASFFTRNALRVYRKGGAWLLDVIFWLSVALIFILLARDAALQHLAWASTELGRYFLPPFADPSYFWQYVGTRFFAPWLIALSAALIFTAIAEFANRCLGERFFEREELPLMKIGIFLSGYPGFFFYIIFVLLAELALSAFYSLTRGERAPLYFLWMPLAILAIILRITIIPHDAILFFNL